MIFAYGITSVLSLLLLVLYFWGDQKKSRLLISLFACIFLCNLGYFLLAAARTLPFALMANRITYLGSVFLPYILLMLILDICGIKGSKSLRIVLIVISCAVLLVAISPGILPIYYKTVSLERTRYCAKLIREYGPLHKLYYVYLFAYYAAAIVIVVRAIAKKLVTSPLQVGFLLVLAFGNLAIWLIEQFIPREFEFLSVSYVLTGAMLLLLYGTVRNYDHIYVFTPEAASAPPLTEADATEFFSPAQIEQIFACAEVTELLTPREADVLRCILENRKRKEIADELFVTESTIKKHTAQIYRKLGVSSRIELFALLQHYKQ